MGMINKFYNEVIDGIEISWCKQFKEDDLGRTITGIKIHSIIDPERNSPAIRISDNGFEYIEPEIPEYPEPEGLIVFGNHKHDRFTTNEVIEQYPEYKKALNKLLRLIDERSQAAAILGRKGGSKTSPAKKRSSAENGKKGGRPKAKPE
jgi:hypothetical protein